MTEQLDYTPRPEYQRRLELRTKELKHLETLHQSMGRYRILCFVLICALAYASIGAKLLPESAIGLPLIAFVVLASRHERIIRRLSSTRKSVQLWKLGLDRLDGRWDGRGASGSRFRSSDHPYSEDLNLFGPGSLFELICAARTRRGEDRLADWLSYPVLAEEIVQRQQAVQELTDRLDLREALALSGDEATACVDLRPLAHWAEQTMSPPPPATVLFAWFFSIAAVATTIYAFAVGIRWPVEIAVAAGQIFAQMRRKRDRAAADQIDRMLKDLAVLRDLLGSLEPESFQSERLRAIAARLAIQGQPVSARIRRLAAIVACRDVMRNQFFSLFGILLLWNTHTAFALERWRAENGPLTVDWIEALADFEALVSLARWRYERPESVFPTIETDSAVVEATGLVHPLLPRATAIANDVSLNSVTRIYIVSGSNMSGKSTLMRTTGVNCVLGLAGGPVCAESMRLSILHIGASLNTNDSLNAGVSRFYAEISRLKQIVDIAAASPPALFLLDEILHGTNSHDRTLGAEAILHALSKSGAMGMVTTHDLALARIAEEPELHAINVHFQDEMVDGKMHFDYKLHPGVVARSNAIPLMRAVGLDV